jgi:hypothetical protein
MTSKNTRNPGGMTMGWFGPSKDEVWRQLSQETGAEFVEGGMWKGNKVQAHVGPWTVTLDTFTVHTQHSHVTYTRIRAPYVNPEGFRFTIYRKGFFSDLGKLLGMQDIEVGDPEFDEAFVIQGNDEARVVTLFSDPKVRSLIGGATQDQAGGQGQRGVVRSSIPRGRRRVALPGRRGDQGRGTVEGVVRSVL